MAHLLLLHGHRLGAKVTILSGMNLEAEVIAGEARDALVVPKQALRELEPGSFAVFIVAADGQFY